MQHALYKQEHDVDVLQIGLLGNYAETRLRKKSVMQPIARVRFKPCEHYHEQRHNKPCDCIVTHTNVGVARNYVT